MSIPHDTPGRDIWAKQADVANAGHPSRSQRQYKVRFQSDIRRPKRPRNPVSQDRVSQEGNSAVSLTTTNSTKELTTDESHDVVVQVIQNRASAAPSPSSEFYSNSGVDRPSQTFLEDGTPRQHFVDELQYQSIRDDIGTQLAAVEDASLLYAFSTTNRHYDVSEQQLSPSLDNSLYDFNQEDTQVSSTALQQETNAFSGSQILSPGATRRRHSIFSSTGLSPELTFQADILPNIPRELPSPSTWGASPSSDRRFYLQYCECISFR